MIDLSGVPGRLALVVLVLALATLAWLVLRRRHGHPVPVRSEIRDGRLAEALLATQSRAGAAATIVQVSAEACAPCRQAARVWSSLAATTDGLEHVEVDVEHHPDLVARLRVLRTPTSFVFDGEGRLTARVAGAPSPRQARDAVDPLLGKVAA